MGFLTKTAIRTIIVFALAGFLAGLAQDAARTLGLTQQFAEFLMDGGRVLFDLARSVLGG